MASKSTIPTRATGLAVTKLPCSVTKVQGYWSGAADAWLQIFDSDLPVATLNTAHANPVKTYQLAAQSAFSWAFEPGELVLKTGCTVAISLLAQPNALYIVTDTADIEVEYAPTSTVTEPTRKAQATGDDSGAIGTAGTRIVEAVVVLNEALTTGVSGVDGYLLLFGHAATAGDAAITAWPLVSTVAKTLNFGPNGLGVKDADGSTPYLYLSADGLVLDATGLLADSTFDVTYV